MHPFSLAAFISFVFSGFQQFDHGIYSMHFFEFVLFQSRWACWIYTFVFCQNWGAFNFSSNVFVCTTLSHLLLELQWHICEAFWCCLTGAKAQFIFLKVLFPNLFFRMDNFYSCHFYLRIHWLFPLSYPLHFWTHPVTFFKFLVIVLFSYKISIWFFFIASISLLLGTWL